MIFKFLFTAVVAFGTGMAFWDTWKEHDKQPQVAVRQEPKLLNPLQCDATIEQRSKPTEPWSRKCYIAGMRK